MRIAAILEPGSRFAGSLEGLNSEPLDSFLAGAAVPGHPLLLNLCGADSHLSLGYHASLVAEARGYRVLPSVQTLADLQQDELQAAMLTELNACLAAGLPLLPESRREPLWILFGRAVDPRFQELARRAFAAYPCPLLLLRFAADETWRVAAVRAGRLNDLPRQHERAFAEALQAWAADLHPAGGKALRQSYRLALLHDPDEPFPPSKPRALEKFAAIGAELGIEVTPMRDADALDLAGADALFIRETTAVHHPSFALARAAEALGKPAIDDSASILRCGNKIFLYELLRRHGIATPRSAVTPPAGLLAAARAFGYPVIVKVPDSCSSLGVYRVEDAGALAGLGQRLAQASPLLLVQEYMYTSFDWRVGVLAGQPLFACRYAMAAGHWQVFHHVEGQESEEGRTESLPLERVPETVLETALAAARLLGNGLYGVDLKETRGQVFVIEVNDCPNIDVGCEDAAGGDEIYRAILGEFKLRIDRARAAQPREAWHRLQTQPILARIAAGLGQTRGPSRAAG